MQIYELVWVLGIAGIILYGLLIDNGRWKITIRLIIIGACLLWIVLVWKWIQFEIT